MELILKKIIVGPLQANCYIFGDENTKEVIIIDPGAEGNKIFKTISEEGYGVKYIIFTHGHADHIAAGAFLRDKTNGIIAIHCYDRDFLEDQSKNLSHFTGEHIEIKDNILELKDGDILNVGKYNLTVMHTPGHTPGGICVSTQNILFAGDTLFNSSIGRTDLPLGNYNDIITSIKEKLYKLDDNTKVYPGHGLETTIGYEKKNNFFVKG
jgi:glyoxylase-like metal-dependent hydrolase (beta-lactamase superfamily II)